MKMLKKITSVAVLSILLNYSYAQTADEIVDNYFSAIGGKEKINALKTVYSVGEINIMNNPAPFATTITDGQGYKNEITLNGQTIITCYSVNKGWTVNPLAGVNAPSPLPADQVAVGQMTFDLKGPLFDYKAKGSKLTLAGKEKLGAADVYKLALVTKDGTPMYFYIDNSNWWLVKTTAQLSLGGNAFEIVTVNSNYLQTNGGLFMPYTVETTYPGLTVTAVAKTIEVNKPIDAAVYTMPVK